jgi:hypothetical protein
VTPRHLTALSSWSRFQLYVQGGPIQPSRSRLATPSPVCVCFFLVVYLYFMYDLLSMGQVSLRAHPARPGFGTFPGHGVALSTDSRSHMCILEYLSVYAFAQQDFLSVLIHMCIL